MKESIPKPLRRYGVSEEEYSRIKRDDEFFKERPEYEEGKIPLNFSFEISDGEKLRAYEEREVVKVVIEGKEGIIVDFDDFLPAGYQLVTPHFIRFASTSDEALRGIDVTWAHDANYGLVGIGDWREPQELFFFLHELGHARTTSRVKYHLNEIALLPSEIQQGAIRDFSEDERKAHAEGLRIARKILKEHHINLFSVFKSREELRDFMYRTLESHRVSKMIEVGLGKDAADYVKSRSWSFIKREILKLKTLTEEEGKFWGKLFDRDYFKRQEKKKDETSR